MNAFYFSEELRGVKITVIIVKSASVTINHATGTKLP